MFEKGKPIRAADLNRVSAAASAARIQGASAGAYSNNRGLVTRSPKKAAARPPRAEAARIFDVRLAPGSAGEGGAPAKPEVWIFLGPQPRLSVLVNNRPVGAVWANGAPAQAGDDGWCMLGSAESGHVTLAVRPEAGETSDPGKLLPAGGGLVADLRVGGANPWSLPVYAARTDGYPKASAPVIIARFSPSAVIQMHCGTIAMASVSADADEQAAAFSSVTMRDAPGGSGARGRLALLGFRDPLPDFAASPGEAGDDPEALMLLARRKTASGAGLRYVTIGALKAWINGLIDARMGG